jgi:DNA-binding response OmpR family regulator
MGLPRLLVIDDDMQLLRALARMLRRTFLVTLAPTLVDAYRLLAAESFDAILCDSRMPLMTGESFVATLPACAASLVVFMSGDEQPEDAVSLHPRLLKPFTLAELLHAIACRRPTAA